ncbi:aminotransferase class III-fold pyridoxal phosphate-dependent enzyme [Ruegeria sp. HKCCD9179]|uniref:aminotransferase class III-fold pyridoxal phosphate-dependent enzyme n=1 Tax=unclassified Ruegeria TaxID=2625375 RepID=UPI00352DA7D9
MLFDEVVTGFSLSYGGAQENYGVTPDLCTLGKVVGGGFPLAALARRKDFMDHFDKIIVGPDKWLMMVGTLCGNPLAAVVGRNTMETLRRDGTYERLYANGKRLMGVLSGSLEAAEISDQIVGYRSYSMPLCVSREYSESRASFTPTLR